MSEDIFSGGFIEVLGAKVHNLKNIDIKIPRNKLVVITGLSGSGKSSLAFDTIYAEGQRRYLETFSAYARQFMGNIERPDVDKITGLSPVISIEQKTTGNNPRSTVGTITEIYDFLRLLYARAADAYSYKTGKKMVQYSRKPRVSSKSALAQVSDLTCHFKNTFETANAIKRMPLRKAQQYYRQVLAKTRCVPFKRYNRKVGRTAQAKEFASTTKGRWPRKSVVAMMGLLKNAEANALAKGLDPNSLVVSHIQVDQAARMRRRTYRAHGRAGPYMRSPCHVQLALSERKAAVPKPTSAPKRN